MHDVVRSDGEFLPIGTEGDRDRPILEVLEPGEFLESLNIAFPLGLLPLHGPLETL